MALGPLCVFSACFAVVQFGAPFSDGLNAGELSGGNVLVVSSDKVPVPVRVRYLDDPDAIGSVYNEANLPLGYFKAGE